MHVLTLDHFVEDQVLYPWGRFSRSLGGDCCSHPARSYDIITIHLFSPWHTEPIHPWTKLGLFSLVDDMGYELTVCLAQESKMPISLSGSHKVPSCSGSPSRLAQTRNPLHQLINGLEFFPSGKDATSKIQKGLALSFFLAIKSRWCNNLLLTWRSDPSCPRLLGP